MKLDVLLEQYPWEGTREVLCQQLPAQEQLPLEAAKRLIAQQRASQVEMLLSLMISPRLQREQAISSAAGLGGVREPRADTFQLRDPRRSARLFIDRALRTGKDLRPFEAEELEKLDREDAALGRLLRLMALAQESSRVERRGEKQVWAEITLTHGNFGLVLTPMVYGDDGARRRNNDSQIEELVSALAQGLGKSATTEDEGLLRWTTRLAREGHARLRELRADR